MMILPKRLRQDASSARLQKTTVENAYPPISNTVMSSELLRRTSPGRPDTAQNTRLHPEMLTGASRKAAAAPVLLTTDLCALC